MKLQPRFLTINIVKQWAAGNGIVSSKSKSVPNRIILICNHGGPGRVQVKNEKDRKAPRKITKQNCPFSVKINRSTKEYKTGDKSFRFMVVPPKEKEHQHNHQIANITAEDGLERVLAQVKEKYHALETLEEKKALLAIIEATLKEGDGCREEDQMDGIIENFVEDVIDNDINETPSIFQSDKLFLPPKREAIVPPLFFEKNEPAETFTSADLYVSSHIPVNSYERPIDVEKDGNCGFRALAVQLFQHQKEYIKVKWLMRDMLLKNWEHYIRLFPKERGYDLDRSKRIICSGMDPDLGYGDEDETKYKWLFAPYCAQIAADTFGRPVAVYHPALLNKYKKVVEEASPSICLPIMKNNCYDPQLKDKPVPLLLQNNDETHWITLKMKDRAEITWPRVPRSQVKWIQLARSFGKVVHVIDMSFWNHFKFHNDKKDSVKQTKQNTVNLVEEEDIIVVNEE